MYFTKIFFVVPKLHKHFHPSSVVPPCKAAVKVLNNLSTQHALNTLFLASFVNRFYCWNIEVVYEVSRSPWLMCPWNTMKSVPACVKMILTDLRHVQQLPTEACGMLEMNLCRCSYLIHYHWKLTRFSFYPDVLLLIGWSRTDWNLINLPNGFDCCGIPIECSESILERPKNKNKKSLEQIWTITYELWRLFSSILLR